MIRNLIFDMGDVLLDYRPMDTCLRHAPTPEDARAVCEALFRAPEWEQKLDACLISEEEMLETAQARVGTEALRELTARVFADYHTDALIPKPGMDALVQSLHERGFRLFLLSNVGIRFFRYQHRIPHGELFDGFLTSGEEKLLKPDPAIFRRLCEKYGLLPEECLFVDDREPNVDGAKAAGMDGYLFDHGDVAALAHWLDGLDAPGGTAAGAG